LIVLLTVSNLKKFFPRTGVTAVDNVSFSLSKGKTLGIVGESGCGKSTLAKLVLFLLRADGGDIRFEGQSVAVFSPEAMSRFREKTQIIFQEPVLSLDPRFSVRDVLEEPFLIRKMSDRDFLNQKVAQLLRSVDLPLDFVRRRPRELSGGECQRVAIARALSLEPELLVCDEPVASLDTLTRVQVLNLLLKIQKERGTAILFISHDLRAVRHMSDEVLQMKEGRIIF
jgi:ABC-type glutathione transport system ATPase component